MSLHKQSSSVTTGSSSSSSENPFSKEPTYYLREMEISLFRSFYRNCPPIVTPYDRKPTV